MKSRSRRRAPGDRLLVRLARTILKRVRKADARSKPRLLGAYRLLVGIDPALLKMAAA